MKNTLIKKLIVAVIVTATAIFQPASSPRAAVEWTPVPEVENPTKVCDEKHPQARRQCIGWKDDESLKPAYSQKLQWNEIDGRNLSDEELTEMFGNRAAGTGASTEGVEWDNNTGAWKINAGTIGNFGKRRNKLRKPQASIIGLYDQLNHVLRIVAIRVDVGPYRKGDVNEQEWVKDDFKIRVFQASVGPRYFDYLKTTSRFFYDDGTAVAEDGYSGINPWARFDRDDGENLFHNIDFAAAVAALAAAQIRLGSPLAYMLAPKPEIRSSTVVRKRGLFKKEYKTFFHGDLRPEWFVSIANNKGGKYLSNGVITAFCAAPLADNADGHGGNCPKRGRVISDATLLDMTGGNLPSMLEPMHKSLYASKKGWSVLGFAIAIFLAVSVGTFYFAPGAAATVGNAAAYSANFLQLGSQLTGAALTGGVASAAYIVSNELLNNSGAGDYQRGLYGSKVSSGVVVVDLSDEETISNTMAGKPHYSDFARATHKALSVENPKDSITAMKCFWGGSCTAPHSIADSARISESSKSYNKVRDDYEIKLAQQFAELRRANIAATDADVVQSGEDTLNKIIAGIEEEGRYSMVVFDAHNTKIALVSNVIDDHIELSLRDSTLPMDESKGRIRISFEEMTRLLDKGRYQVYKITDWYKIIKGAVTQPIEEYRIK